MRKLMETTKRFFADEKAAEVTELGIVLALVVAGSVAILAAIGPKIIAAYTTTNAAMTRCTVKLLCPRIPRRIPRNANPNFCSQLRLGGRNFSDINGHPLDQYVAVASSSSDLASIAWRRRRL